ncbi:sentrin-specific protease 1-like [Exaiptasia diaphana]|uniref:Ubiquitin-like protease family profile domain-containing protein n=1 Tax=Exaiptasia diaphana TaxID=2652724 RepID=A0A913YRK9_EXADI|nr:sentrin-specific protease 1-like [Exaiptasia diaphana]
MDMIIKEAANRGIKAHCFNSLIIEKLRTTEKSSLACIDEIFKNKRNRDHRLFQCQFVLCPINKDAHWTLLVVKPQTNAIEHYDSLGGDPQSDVISSVLELLCYAHVAEFNVPLDVNNWVSVKFKNIPLQGNSHDCGVFLCMFAKYVTLGKTIDFNQGDMAFFRSQMIREIASGSLI